MQEPKISFLEISYDNEVHLVNKILSIYSLTKEDNVPPEGSKFKSYKLRPFERDVLNYYIRYGYSPETKLIVEEDLDKTQNNITQIDFLLKSKGYIEDAENNYRMKKLNPYLEEVRKKFILDKRRVYAIHFKKS